MSAEMRSKCALTAIVGQALRLSGSRRNAPVRGSVLSLWLLASAAISLSTAALGKDLQPPADEWLRIPAAASQGTLVIGSTEPDSTVKLGDRVLRIDPQGQFVFGVGRDEPGPLTVTATRANGQSTEKSVAIFSREWRTERVTGVPQSTVTPNPKLAERMAQEQARVTAARATDAPSDDFPEQFLWPTRGRISGVFGSQRIYNGTPKAPHSGLDVAAPEGTPLKSPAAGRVTFADPDLYLTGGTVLIDHGHGVSSVFLHLSRIDVGLGQTLAAGEIFGHVGATGRATGPHMHWGVNWFNVRIDPATLPGIAED